MSRYRDADCKICRRSRVKLFLKGDKCYSDKCPILKRNTPPGHRVSMGRRLSEYGIRLREKQKLRFFYGVTETQMRNYFKKAVNQKGIAGYNLLKLFELRLDNVIYRMGMAESRKKARQMAQHNFVTLNDTKVNIPSILVKEGDVLKMKKSDKGFVKERLEGLKNYEFPAWIEYNAQKQEFKILQVPEYEEIDAPVDVQLIVEYYSR